MQKSGSTPPLDVDQLVDLKTGYGMVGVSVAQGIRRESEPALYPDWIERYQVGRGKDGRVLSALRLSDIRRYIATRPKVEKPVTKNPVLQARGSKGGKAKARQRAQVTA